MKNKQENQMVKTRHKWRQFRPRNTLAKNVIRIVQPRAVRTELWQQAMGRVHEMFPGRQLRDDVISRAIHAARDRASVTDDPIDWCVALILQAPRAASAQEQMDQHPHGYHNKQERLYELIDFNDTYVSAVLSMPESQLMHFADEAKRAMDVFCKQVRTRCFSNEQFEAITHGLSREVAVYRGVIKSGYDAQMTTRAQDAFGIDMVITDHASERSINVDCKTHSAFYYRLKDLSHEGRLTTEQVAKAEDDGYCLVVNGDEVQSVEVVLWRIDQETYGTIQDFSFVSVGALSEKLHEIIERHGTFRVD